MNEIVEQKAQTPAQQQKARTDALVAAVEGKSREFQVLLGESGISFDRFVEVFRRAVIQSNDILQADAGSVIKACIDAATNGLLPDGRNGAIVVYNVNVAGRGEQKRWVKKAQFLPMVQGLLDLAYRSGNFKDIQARVVYEGDEFDYELGMEPWIKHKPARRPARGEGVPPVQIIAAYAVARGVDGGTWVEVFEGEDIRKVRAVSRATSGPNKDWEEEMSRKGPLRRLWKYLPKNDRMERVVDTDDETYDLEALEQPPPKERKLIAGFAPPAPKLSAPNPEPEPEGEPEPDAPEPDAASVSAAPPEIDAQVDPEPPPPPEPTDSKTLPSTFYSRLAEAQTWLSIKQVMRTLAKDYPERLPEWRLVAMESAWKRFDELRELGADKTDIIMDPLLFECWVVVTEPDAESIMGNWRVVETSPPFKRLDDAERARFKSVVETAMRGSQQ